MAQPIVTSNCQLCGKEFTVPFPRRRQRFCSQTCSARSRGDSHLPLGERVIRRILKTTTCWLWLGNKLGGYGSFDLTVRRNGSKRHQIMAHRLSYIMHYGSIPDGLLVCHRCDNPPCVNPEHLFLGTDADNSHDRDRKGRQVPHRGSKNGSAKLTEDDVRQIRYLCLNTNLNRAKIAARFNVGREMINRIHRRENWKHLD